VKKGELLYKNQKINFWIFDFEVVQKNKNLFLKKL
jgi:hypothetical protein